MGNFKHTLLIATANLLLGTAILVFAVGFFPHKAFLPGLATWSDDTSRNVGKAPFDKIIFMVVDALRSDFVYGNDSNFHFTQSLIRSGAAVPFTGHASPPTITMPRVKAITTGSVPSFIDLLLNFAESDTSSTLATQDSWLAQLKAKEGSKLVMYGDDTWLRLFPGFFERADGTTSFFVSDFTEVDNNVTRHIPQELEQEDWSAMIMHYLGMDHIGHKTGPKGPNMPAKQQEMDGIVEQIYRAMEQKKHLQSSMLVLLGDHGMNEAGNHGANSAGEVSTALTFISPKFKSIFGGFQSPVHETKDYKYYEEVEQSDIAPTLAALLGFPIPRNSLGSIIPQILELWSTEEEKCKKLYLNAQQIKLVAEATYPDVFSEIPNASSCETSNKHSDAEELACQWANVFQSVNDFQKGTVEVQITMAKLKEFLKQAQSLLSGTASKYDLTKMYVGAGLATVSVALTTWAEGPALFQGGWAGFVFVGTLLSYAITMFASSYVEEEQQFWYWLTSAWLFSLACRSTRFEMKLNKSSSANYFSICLLFGIVRRWNQTGQKYAGEPDLATEILAPSPGVLWTLIFITYSIVPRRLRQRPAELGLKQVAILPVLVTASALLFKLAFTAADAPELLPRNGIVNSVLSFAQHYPLVSLARLVFLGLANLIVTAIYCEKPWTSQQHRTSFLQTLHEIVSLFLITQTRTINIPLFLIFHVKLILLQRSPPLDMPELLLTSLCMQFSSFFAFGGTNAISSVDLSNAYNGINGYNVAAVGALTFISNWAGPIWWASATACTLTSRMTSRRQRTGVNYFGGMTMFASCSTLAVMAACTLLREHLFIWTVFSPKYLYTMAWTFAQHMLVNGISGTRVGSG